MAIITYTSNNYGPYQFPEKFVPLIILNALKGKPLPVYGTGNNVRDWIYVEDHATALRQVLAQGKPGCSYNIGSRCEKTNLEVVNAICELLDKIKADPEGPYRRVIRHVTARPGHDRRYAIDSSRIMHELGWRPKETFESGLEKTVRCYLDNPDWIRRVQTGEYRAWLDTNYAERLAAE